MSPAKDGFRGLTVWVVLMLLGLVGILIFAAFNDSETDKDPILTMTEGISWLEKYQYGKAYEDFERLTELQPRWAAAWVNKGIAALNLLDAYLPIAERDLNRALELDPTNPNALHCLGILYRHTSRFLEALEVFTRLSKVDPDAPFGQFFLGTTLMDLNRYEEAQAPLENALRLQPSLSSAYWRLRAVYLKLRQAGKLDPEEFARRFEVILAEFQRLEAGKVGLKADLKYGSSGKYSLAIRDSLPPDWKGPAPTWTPTPSPVFRPAVPISSSPAVRRVKPDGRPLTPAFALGDLTGDGNLEIVLCGVARGDGVGTPTPPGAAPLGLVTLHARNKEGGYEEIARIEENAVVAALGDLDGDADSDLVLAGENWLRIYENGGDGRFKPATLDTGNQHEGFPVRLLVVDADSDWDLDIICMRQVVTGEKVTTRLELLNNNRDGTFVEISERSGLGPFPFPAAELIVADLDGDIDADIVVVDGESGQLIPFANDRIWRYRRVEGKASEKSPSVRGVTSTTLGDFDSDGDEDLVFFTTTGTQLIVNDGGLRFSGSASFAERFSALGETSGVLGDFQGALRLGLLLLRPRAEGRQVFFVAEPTSEVAAPVESLEIRVPAMTDLSAAFTAVVPCGAPELIVYDAEVGARAWPLDTSVNWLGLQLEGPHSPIPDKERANVGGVGAVVEVHVGALSQTLQLHTGGAGTVRQSTRVTLGLAGSDHADFVRILWPDGILQAERALVACELHRIDEVERKPSSCPILFAWNGDAYEFVGDFLGVGGIGYFEGPGAYNTPDPTEFLLLPELAPVTTDEGVDEYRLEVLEPLEECTYLDEFKLTVVDHPEDVTVLPDEMFAIRGPVPGFRLLAFRDQAFPVRATNLEGDLVTERLLEVDRKYGNDIRLDRRFSGLARSEHGIVMDFDGAIADRLGRQSDDGGRLYLFLHGFIEYGYSTSNFAASQAGIVFEPPTFEVERGGEWVPLREHWGFPAGYPRYMSIDLGGLLHASDRRIRVRTNMEIYWDQAFIACVQPDEPPSRDVSVDAAELGFAGFLPERSPDGRLPRIYVYGEFSPTMTFKFLPGAYTRCGDVRELLGRTDDRFVIMGPGDRLSLRVRTDRLPPLARGMKRTFLAKTSGYCKDMDLYTAHPDRVEPLPFGAMKAYPYVSGEEYPDNRPELQTYRRRWNTRVVEGTFMDGYDRAPAE